jgi:hypothetical protein
LQLTPIFEIIANKKAALIRGRFDISYSRNVIVSFFFSMTLQRIYCYSVPSAISAMTASIIGVRVNVLISENNSLTETCYRLRPEEEKGERRKERKIKRIKRTKETRKNVSKKYLG